MIVLRRDLTVWGSFLESTESFTKKELKQKNFPSASFLNLRFRL